MYKAVRYKPQTTSFFMYFLLGPLANHFNKYNLMTNKNIQHETNGKFIITRYCKFSLHVCLNT